MHETFLKYAKSQNQNGSESFRAFRLPTIIIREILFPARPEHVKVQIRHVTPAKSETSRKKIYLPVFKSGNLSVLILQGRSALREAKVHVGQNFALMYVWTIVFCLETRRVWRTSHLKNK